MIQFERAEKGITDFTIKCYIQNKFQVVGPMNLKDNDTYCGNIVTSNNLLTFTFASCPNTCP